jgi:deoxyribonuclease-4
MAGALPMAVDRALERDCTTFQIFCGNPRGWHLQDRDDEELAAFRKARSAAGLKPLFVHACYLINSCASDTTVYRRSIRRLRDELDLTAGIGAEFYVLHPGSHKGRPHDWGVQRATDAISRALARANSAPTLLLENTASAHGPGGSAETLGALLHGIEDAAPEAEVGLAIDSCHAFGAGYDLRRADEVERLVCKLSKAAGPGRIRLLHVNDSRDQPGSKRDRHTHIGDGNIGDEGFRHFLNHPALSDLPLILETPWESVETDLRNLRRVRSLLD